MHPKNEKTMVKDLLVIWAIGVVAFFVLWGILAKVIQRISRRKQGDDTVLADTQPTDKDIPDETP